MLFKINILHILHYNLEYLHCTNNALCRRFVRNMAQRCRPKASRTQQTCRGLDAIAQCSTQILFNSIYFPTINASLAGMGFRFEDCRCAFASSAILHCVQNEAAPQIVKSINIPCKGEKGSRIKTLWHLWYRLVKRVDNTDYMFTNGKIINPGAKYTESCVMLVSNFI